MLISDTFTTSRAKILHQSYQKSLILLTYLPRILIAWPIMFVHSMRTDIVDFNETKISHCTQAGSASHHTSWGPNGWEGGRAIKFFTRLERTLEATLRTYGWFEGIAPVHRWFEGRTPAWLMWRHCAGTQFTMHENHVVVEIITPKFRCRAELALLAAP